jgi:hypothetical protein
VARAVADVVAADVVAAVVAAAADVFDERARLAVILPVVDGPRMHPPPV